ncbi:Vesicle transport v-SNARE protein [Phytophthora cinnamomi]|uniref:Vesicle transport v-SNARE protein n=1 Tax=Phytophthora cinnamomi TaxID=4785 RepID=UPI003559FB6B|nr:Vesicle transport v-SNARE protein [Phytophthora cinnamomi]
MAEISYYDADLSDAITKLNDLMGKVAKAPPGVRPEMLAMAEVKLKEMMELKKGFQLALRQAPRDQVTAFREKFEEHCARVEELSSEFRWAKAEQERNGLFGDRAAASAGARGTNGLGNKELLDKTIDIQSKTEQSLMSTAKMVEQSKEVAAATAEVLRGQREHIVEITDAVMGIEDSLQRADKLIRSFARRMATDRVILLFTFLVIVGIAGIVGYKSVHPNDTTFYVPDEVTPPNPTALYNTTVSAINSTLSSRT